MSIFKFLSSHFDCLKLSDIVCCYQVNKISWNQVLTYDNKNVNDCYVTFTFTLSPYDYESEQNRNLKKKCYHVISADRFSIALSLCIILLDVPHTLHSSDSS